ncbi:MAG: energy transducer TonB [Burkholderiaceae bacterium]
MDYAQEQRNPTKHVVGIVVVVLLHIALVYALVNGLARKVVEVIKKPLETQIIEEIKPPPPPPPVSLPPPPRFVSPPPPYIPPPEVQVNVPPPPNAIQTTTSVLPTVSPPIAVVAPPVAPPAPSAPPAPPAPSVRSACTNYAKVLGDSAYPRDAVREGIDSGQATLRWTVTTTGEIKDAAVVSQSNRVFGRQALTLLRDVKCAGQSKDVIFELQFSFKRE